MTHALGNLAAGSVEGSSGIFPKRGIDGESEETVWFGSFGLDGETLDLLLGTETAGPLFTREGDPDSTTELGGIRLEGLSVRAGAEASVEKADGCDLESGGLFRPRQKAAFRVNVLIWHGGTSLSDRGDGVLTPKGRVEEVRGEYRSVQRTMVPNNRLQ